MLVVFEPYRNKIEVVVSECSHHINLCIVSWINWFSTNSYYWCKVSIFNWKFCFPHSLQIL